MAQLVYGRVVQRVFQADQKIIFFNQRDEIQPELRRCGLNARPL